MKQQFNSLLFNYYFFLSVVSFDHTLSLSKVALHRQTVCLIYTFIMHNYLLFSYHITDRHLAAGIYALFRQVNETGLLETKSNWLKFSCLFIIERSL